MPLKSQSHPHSTPVHCEILIFPYKEPLLENHNVFFLKNLSSLPFIEFVKVPFCWILVVLLKQQNLAKLCGKP